MKKSIIIVDQKKVNIFWETILSFCTLYEARILYTKLTKNLDIKDLSNPTPIYINWSRETKYLRCVKKYKRKFEITIEEDPYYYSIQDPWKILNYFNYRHYNLSFKTNTEFNISEFLKFHNIDIGIINLTELSEANIFNDPIKVYIWKKD